MPLALGKGRWLRRIDQVFGGNPSTKWNSKYKFKKAITIDNETGQKIPFLVEVAVKAFNDTSKRKIHVAINRGPEPDDGSCNLRLRGYCEWKNIAKYLGI